MIEVTDLAKSFGDIKAVRGISFYAPNGKITGVLGPNGAGKSTTLRLITGILEPDAGMAQVDGLHSWSQRLEAQKRLGALPDKRGIYQRLTTRENIRYYGQLQGMGGEALERRIDELIEMLGMEDFASRRTEGFSTGQKVKVAIARAIVHNPPNIILDEPTGGLDVMSTRAMRQMIRRLREAGQCVLFSSHVMQEVAALCDYIVVIAKGEIAAQGTPDDLRRATGKQDLEDAFVVAAGTEEGFE